MAISRIKLSNFKSFNELDIELGKFNVLVGANASGKSNFVQIFKFLKDIINHGLDNAISMQGGIEYLRNIRVGSSKQFSLEVVFAFGEDFGLARKKEKKLIGVNIYETIYKLAIKLEEKSRGFKIFEDKLTHKCKFGYLEKKEKPFEEKGNLEPGEIILSNDNGKINICLNIPQSFPLEDDDILPPFFKEEKLPPNALLIQTPLFFIPPFEWIYSDISIYDFDPKLPKKSASISGKAELEEDGSNLALVLKNVTEDKDKKRKFSNLIKDILPFVKDLGIKNLADKSFLMQIQEDYFGKQYLPAFLLSDGTMNITALIIALYFEKKSLTIIEEPERNIHPFLISKVTDMMKDASQKKQIIVTTHNPEVVKHAGLENILLVSRDKEGFSNISKPSEKKEIKTFLENDMGIDELFVQNLLGI